MKTTLHHLTLLLIKPISFWPMRRYLDIGKTFSVLILLTVGENWELGTDQSVVSFATSLFTERGYN